MRRKFQHFLLFLLLLNCSWAYGINSQVNIKHSFGNAVGAGSLTIDKITNGPCTLDVYWTCSNCDVDGFNVTWQEAGKSKESVQSLISDRSDDYLIENLNSDASYTVWVAAVVDGEETLSKSAQQSTTEGEPVKVTGVTIGEVSDTVINVSWEETKNDCPIQGYLVTWTGTAKWDSENHPNGDSETDKLAMEVDNLVPYADYEIRVSEITTDGIVGDPSDPATATTEQGAASAPESVTSITLGPNSAQVNWTLPEASNGVILGYHVSCQILPEPTDECDILIADPDIFTTDVTELKACGDYTFSVQAINGYRGYGEPGTHSSRTDSEPPPIIANFGNNNITSTSVNLTWDPLDTNCPVSIYNIYAVEIVLWSDTTDTIRQSSPGEDNFYLLEKLTPYSQYDISIRATTEGGITKAEDAAKQEVVTDQGEADAPTFLNSSTIDKSTVSLYWSPPENINGVLEGYVICYKKDNDIRSDCPITTGINTLNYDVADLDACGNYTFTVQAINGAGNGKKASTEANTENEEPQELGAVKSVTPNSTFMTITFDPPATTCDILRYDIVGEGITKWDNKSVDYTGILFVESDGTGVVQNLIPFTSYTFNMSATTEGGTSNGVMFEGDTEKDAPSEPRNLKATPVDTTSIKVTWNEPEYQNGRRLGSYYLTYGLLGSQNDAIEVILKQYTIGDKSHDNEVLLPCQTYNIRVSASNEVGNSTAASVREGLDSEVPDAVTFLRCKNTEAKKIELAWNVQRTACRTTYYEIFADGDILWGDTTNKTLNVSNIPSIRGSYTLDDLIAYTSYNITLTPGNDAGLGEPKSLTCETKQTVPEPPTNLKVKDRTKSKLEIQWDAPAMKNGFLTSFRLTWNDNEKDDRYIDANNDTNTYSYKLEDLDDDTYYSINIYAANSIGWSEASDEFQPDTDKSHLGAILGTVIPLIVIIIAIIAGVLYNKSSKKKKKNKANVDD